LHALADVLKTGPVEVTVLGSGPLFGRWRKLAKQLGVDSVIKWTGHLSHDQAVTTLGESDVLAFTSLQEGTPFAVLEALSLEIPVICHDACGMGIAVTEDCGIKIPMQNPAFSAAGFARAICRLRDDSELLIRMSGGAGRRAAELSWSEKASAVAAAYARAWNRHADDSPKCLSEGRTTDSRAHSAQFNNKEPVAAQFGSAGMANAMELS
jgi:glycosyltransferase involved in cell wall biosynthesis